MKRIFCSLILWGVVALMSVAAPKLKFYDAQQFTMVGKLMTGTFNPYHRIDTVKYKGFDKKELLQVRESAGMSIAFKTSSRTIAVRCEFGDVEWPQNSTGIAAHGFDLYIKKDGAWRWAGSGARSQEMLNKALNLATSMDGTEHECLLYLPLFAEVNKLEIGVDADAPIAPSPNPFPILPNDGASAARFGMQRPQQTPTLLCRGTCRCGCRRFHFRQFLESHSQGNQGTPVPFHRTLAKGAPRQTADFPANHRP